MDKLIFRKLKNFIIGYRLYRQRMMFGIHIHTMNYKNILIIIKYVLKIARCSMQVQVEMIMVYVMKKCTT